MSGIRYLSGHSAAFRAYEHVCRVSPALANQVSALTQG
jgi:hypothetical protein